MYFQEKSVPNIYGHAHFPEPLLRDTKTPAMHIAVNIMNDVLMTRISVSGSAPETGTPAIWRSTVTVTITMLSVCPMDLIVASRDDATP